MIRLRDHSYKAFLIIAFVGCAIFPFVVSGFWIRLLSGIFLYAVLAQGLNIIAGFTGYAAFGNMIFFGLGGYLGAQVEHLNQLQALAWMPWLWLPTT
jgi:branched-chain amino acid transport system permease protein